MLNRTYRMLREKGWLILAVLLLVGSVPTVPLALRFAGGLADLLYDAIPRMLRAVVDFVLYP